jgi:hypothetical protein
MLTAPTTATAGRENLLVDLSLDLYVTPKEWVGDGAVKREVQAQKIAEQTAKTTNWFQAGQWKDSPKPKENDVEKSDRKPASESPRLRVDGIVGESVIVGEKIFEEGDTVNGWTLVSVDKRHGKIVVKKGQTFRHLKVSR